MHRASRSRPRRAVLAPVYIAHVPLRQSRNSLSVASARATRPRERYIADAIVVSIVSPDLCLPLVAEDDRARIFTVGRGAPRAAPRRSPNVTTERGGTRSPAIAKRSIPRAIPLLTMTRGRRTWDFSCRRGPRRDTPRVRTSV